MSYVYKPFEVEKWVSNYYYKQGIVQPSDIDEKAIARSLGIFLSYKEQRSYSYEEGRFRMINVDSRLNQEQKREQFFHELCHLLRHCGYQILMPKAFRELQEFDSKRFTRYAAIPFGMLSLIDLKSPYAVQEMSITFNVSEDLCRERLEGIHRNKFPKKVV